MYKKNIKAISSIVAVSLLIVLTVITIVAYQNWFLNYSTNTYSKVEIESKNSNQVNIETVVGNELYFNNIYDENVTINKIQVQGIDCNITPTQIGKGVHKLNINLCIEKLNSRVGDILIFTDKRIISKKHFFNDLNVNTSLINYNYSWTLGSWNTCSEVCGGGVQNRTVECERNDSLIVSDNLCTELKPEITQICNIQSCTPQVFLNGTFRQWSDGNYSTSCYNYLHSPTGYNYSGDIGNGIYRIDTDGSGAIAPIDVYCDMNIDGGGWTLAIKVPYSYSDGMGYTDPRWTNTALASPNVPTDILTNNAVGYVSKSTDLIPTTDFLIYKYEIDRGNKFTTTSGTLRSKVTLSTWTQVTNTMINGGLLNSAILGGAWYTACYGFQAATDWTTCDTSIKTRIVMGAAIYSSKSCSKLTTGVDLQTQAFGLGKRSENTDSGACMSETTPSGGPQYGIINYTTTAAFVFVR